MNPEISFVIPCLNEADSLTHVVERIQEFLVTFDVTGEIIIVDNGSTDNTQEVLGALDVIIIYEPARGYGSAIQSGLMQARGDYLVLGDADGSYDFMDTIKLINAFRAGFDYAQGCRLPAGGGKIERGAMPSHHQYFGNPMLTWLTCLMFSVPVHDVYCGLRGIKRQAFQELELTTSNMTFALELLIKVHQQGLSIAEVPITLYKDKRVNGSSHLQSIRDGLRSVKLLLTLWCKQRFKQW